MKFDAWRVVRYRSRRTLVRRLRGYLAVALLIGVLGGLSLGSIAAARRTQSAYPRFLASTNPSDLQVTVWNYTTSSGAIPIKKQQALFRALARLPEVAHLESAVFPLAAPISSSGQLQRDPGIAPLASADGDFFNQDRPGVVAGRLPDPRRVDEFVTTPQAARNEGWRLGQLIRFAVYRPSQFVSGGTLKGAPARMLLVRLVGLIEFDTAVVQDQADSQTSVAVFTPAFARADAFGGAGTIFAIQLRSPADLVRAEKAIIGVLPPGDVYAFSVTASAVAKVERAVRPESIALGAFGIIVGLAALVIVAMAISRSLRTNESDREILRALGASPFVQIADATVGALGAVLLGCLLAVAVAIGLSPLAPIGSVRAVYPDNGLAVDGPVIGLGSLALLVLLSLLTVLLAWRLTTWRRRAPSIRGIDASARLTSLARAVGLPTPAVLGVRSAVQPSPVRTATPAGVTILGGALAIVLLVTTLTFGASLSTLASHPALYGWNWNYALVGSSDVPPQAEAALRHDSEVTAFSGWDTANVQVDGFTVPTMISEDENPTVAPPLLAGHAVRGPNEVVLGPSTLAALHKRIGETVTLSYGTKADYPVYVPPRRLTVVGTATFPAIGGIGGEATLHTSMGTGMWISWRSASRLHQLLLGTIPTLRGPSIALVRLRPYLSAGQAQANLGQIVALSNRVLARYQDSVTLLSVQRPAEIVNYRSMGATPLLLAAGVAGGAICALALALAASVRTRRRELALLKALGFTSRQLSETVAWQATITAAIGIVVGVPVGIAVGRWLWILFARSIAAVPAVSVPAIEVSIVAAGALVVANLVAALPGRQAGRTSPALVLHSE